MKVTDSSPQNVQIPRQKEKMNLTFRRFPLFLSAAHRKELDVAYGDNKNDHQEQKPHESTCSICRS
jgi:hypothetical protein